MNQKRISAIVTRRLKKIEMLFHKIVSHFEMEPIHEFRTEIKKLRAFFRLMNVEIDDGKLIIPKKIKTFYGYAGTIRNLQLQAKAMHAYGGNSKYTVSEAYIEYLQKTIEKWKEAAIEFAGAGNDFYTDKKEILKQFPTKLRRASAKKFLQNKIFELLCLINDLPDDDVLHSIRKLLKDILYNWAFIKQYNKLLPADFSEERKLKSFTELLGLFLDKRMAIILLETYCKDCEENGLFIEKETTELQEMEGAYAREKQELAQIIYLKPGFPKLLPVN